MKVIHGQPSWRIASDRVEAYVTQLGGQIAPVTFDRQGRKIAPYSIAPWAEEKLDAKTPAILRALRGDFFCLPFGGMQRRIAARNIPYTGKRPTRSGAWRPNRAAAAGIRCG